MSEESQPPKTNAVATDLLRYWEPRRLIYNAALGLIVLVHFFINAPASWQSITLDVVLVTFLLAVTANVLYCAAYLVDGVVQFTPFRTVWLQIRWLMFALGVAFATVLTHFIAKGYFYGAQHLS